MAKKLVSKDKLTKQRNILAKKRPTHRKSNRPAVLTKTDRKEQGIGKDEGRAVLRYARISSRKVKIVIDLIRGKNLAEAYAILRHTPKGASAMLEKLLKSAESNAVNNNDLDADLLYVAEAYANQGPTLKRIKPRARGSASRIRKRTSHITLIVKERE